MSCALTYVAQEVSGLLQQSHPFSVNRDNNLVETISIRAIEPEYKFIIPTSLLGRLIRPEEIANAATFLCSPLVSAFNGSAVRADGGLVRSVF